MIRSLRAAALAAACCAAPAEGHELRPAYLRLDAQPAAADAPERYAVAWKNPLVAGRPLPLAPTFPASCTKARAAVDAVTADALVQRWELACEAGLRGGELAVAGLATTAAEVVLHVDFADGSRIATVLTPGQPSLALPAQGGVAAEGYFRLGVEHMLLGFDHILFVLALLFFLQRLAPLAKAVTAFTVAHSITLGLAALALVRLPQAPVEATIALSIVFLAVEKLREPSAGEREGAPLARREPSAGEREGAAHEGPRLASETAPRMESTTLTARHTWVVAFAFGLLHGFGFAGALAELGLPKESLLLALLLFNLGVEAGQLAAVCAGLGVAWAVRRLGWRLPRWLVRAPLWASGSLAAYWFVSRTAAIVA